MEFQFTPRSSATQSGVGPAQDQTGQQSNPTPLAGPIPTPTQTPPTQQPSIPPSMPPSGPDLRFGEPPGSEKALRAGGKKKIIIFLIVLILAFLTAGFLWFQSRAPKLAAKVGDQKITLSELAAFAQDCDISEKEAVEYLVDEKVLTAWAQDEKISLSKEDQEAEEVRINGEPATIECIRIQAKVNLLREKLSQYNTKFREGKFISINFGLYANPKPFSVTEEATSGASRAERLKEDRDYADNLTKSIYSEIKAGKLSFEVATKKVKDDSRVGENSPYGTSLQSGPFTASDYIKKRIFLYGEPARGKVDSLNVDEISEPFIEQANVANCEIKDPDCKPQYIDTRWLIIKVEAIGKGYSDSGTTLLGKIREQYQATIFLQ